jgi:hypothetical protein
MKTREEETHIEQRRIENTEREPRNQKKKGTNTGDTRKKNRANIVEREREREREIREEEGTYKSKKKIERKKTRGRTRGGENSISRPALHHLHLHLQLQQQVSCVFPLYILITCSATSKLHFSSLHFNYMFL